MSHELLTELDIMVIRTVHVHPVDNNYFMVAGKGYVKKNIYILIYKTFYRNTTLFSFGC